MPYVVGIVLSLGVALFARRVGFDRDRAFYPTVLIVIAHARRLIEHSTRSRSAVVGAGRGYRRHVNGRHLRDPEAALE